MLNNNLSTVEIVLNNLIYGKTPQIDLDAAEISLRMVLKRIISTSFQFFSTENPLRRTVLFPDFSSFTFINNIMLLIFIKVIKSGYDFGKINKASTKII